MLTLDQVRAVNDGFKASDFAAALRPLEESVDLRPAEMPRLEKSSQAVFKSVIQTPETALFWTESCFHPNVSVRRFARKLILGLKDDAKPLAKPLRARIARFLDEERLPMWSENRQEAAQRREQMDVLQNAVELLLRADADEWMDAFTEMLQHVQPMAQQQSAEQSRFQEKWQQLHKAVEEKTDELYASEWGEEMRNRAKRGSLPTRAHREIAEKMKELPETKALEGVALTNPWAGNAQDEVVVTAMHWTQAQQTFNSALSDYVGYNTSPGEAGQKIAKRVRVHLWRWIEAALLEGDEKAASRLWRSGLSHRFDYSLGREELWQRAPALLSEAKAALLPQLMKSSRDFWNNRTPTRAGTWTLLAMALAQSVQRPYNVKEERVLPAELTPEVFSDLKFDSHHKYLNDALEQAIRVLDNQRQKPKQPDEAPKTDVPVVATNAAATNAKPFLSPQQSVEIETKIASDSEIEARVAQLLEPPPRQAVDFQGVPYPRMRWELWSGWERLPGWSAVKKRVWELAAPKLWARLETQIANFRGATAEEPPSNIAAKLSESEIKKWKSESRRRHKDQIKSHFVLLAQFLIEVEGAQAAIRLFETLSSTRGVRELAEEAYTQMLQQLTRAPNMNPKTRTPDENALSQWYLSNEWKLVLEHLAPLVLDPKQRWQYFGSQWAASALAVGFYRLNTEAGRTRCRELALNAGDSSYALAPVVRQRRDVETWLVLLQNVNWPHPELIDLWDDLRLDDAKSVAEVLPRLLQSASATSNERSAKLMLGMLSKVSSEELLPHSEHLAQAAESSLPQVTRWALGELSKMPQASLDWDGVIQVAGEKLWSENGALAKDSAKFLGVIGAKNAGCAPTAWEKLNEAAALENLALLEAIFRALSQIRAKNKELALDENAAARLEELSAAQSERFARFQKKLL